MKLYYVPRTRATRPRWILEELGVPYDLVRLDPAKAETRTPEHLDRQPLGHVPVLEDGEVRIFESVAICLYLAERYGKGKLVAPPGTAARAAMYQWIFFAVSEIESALSAIGNAVRGTPEAEWDQAVIARGKEQAAKALAIVDRALAGKELLAGELSVADILLCSLTSYALMLHVPVTGENLLAHSARLKARPAYRRAIAD